VTTDSPLIFCCPVKRVEFVSDRVSYIVLRGRWCNIIVLNVHAPSEERSESKYSFYEELEQVFYHFPKYHMKILLGDFNSKVAREIIFKLIIGNESLHQDSNDNGVRIVNFATSKNLVVKSTMFQHRNIHNQIDHILIDKRGIRAYQMYEGSVELIVTPINIYWWQKLGKDWR
jgi:endonuclease/exonuclease/phosphatase family metal-dependent hydrolase